MSNLTRCFKSTKFQRKISTSPKLFIFDFLLWWQACLFDMDGRWYCIHEDGLLLLLMMMTWISQSRWWWWWWDGVHIFDVNGCGGYLVEPYCIQDTSVTLWEAGYPHLDIPIYRQRPKDFVLGNCWDGRGGDILSDLWTYSNCSKESKDLILGCINEGFMQGCFLNTLHIHNFDPCSLNIAQRPLAFLKSVAIEIASAGYFPFLFSCAFVRTKFNQKSFF